MCDKYRVAHPVFLSDVLNDIIDVTSKISVVQTVLYPIALRNFA